VRAGEAVRTLLVAALLGLSAVAGAEPVVLRFSTAAPEGTVWAREIRNLIRTIEQRTDGRVRMKPFFGSIAGSEAEALSRIRKGQLDGIMSGGPVCQQVMPSMAVLQVPGLFQEADEVRYVINQMRATLLSEAQQAGFVVPAWMPLGAGMYFGRKPVTSMAQLRTAKLWVWDLEPQLIAFMRDMGLDVVTAPAERAAREFDAGRIDSFWALPTAALAFQWSTQAPHLVDLRGEYLFACVLIASRSLAPVSAEDQRAIMTAGAEATVRVDEATRQQEEALLHGGFQHQGVKLEPVSPAFRSEFFAAARAAREKLGGKGFSAELLHKVTSMLSDYRAEHGSR
jgi:TRAP-type C4-dicarboxylate transport system substrate-binding protein